MILLYQELMENHIYKHKYHKEQVFEHLDCGRSLCRWSWEKTLSCYVKTWTMGEREKSISTSCNVNVLF